MLYFLHGTDTKKSREKLHELLESLQKKKPDAALFRIESETWDHARFEEFLGGQGLFENKYIVVLDRVFENASAKEATIDLLKDIAASDNVFIFIEGDIDAASLKKIEKHAQKTQEFEVREKAEPKSFNIFSLTDALGQRDRKRLWVLYQDALAHGSEPEEIHGILFWQIKSMLTAIGSKSAADSGLKPFVFQKASSFARNYSREELESLSSRFVGIYHDARRGISDMGIALEKCILQM